MLSVLLLISLVARGLGATIAQPTSYAIWSADSAISRGQGNGLGSNGAPLVSYEHGELQWALRLLYERTGNQTYFDYIQQGVDRVVTPNGTVIGGYGSAIYFTPRSFPLTYSLASRQTTSSTPSERDLRSYTCEPARLLTKLACRCSSSHAQI